MFAFDAQQALGFLVSQTSAIEAQAYEIQYPDIQYPALVPVDASANPWAKSVTFFSTDKLGQADWFNHFGKDMPLADVERSERQHPVEMAAAGSAVSVSCCSARVAAPLRRGPGASIASASSSPSRP